MGELKVLEPNGVFPYVLVVGCPDCGDPQEVPCPDCGESLWLESSPTYSEDEDTTRFPLMCKACGKVLVR